MIEVLNYEAAHLKEMVEQKATAYLRPYVTEDHMRALENSPAAFTARINGRIVICAGVIEYWKGRGEAWAFIDRECRKEFYAIHKSVKRYLDICPFKRIEATVDIGFTAGHRWVTALGFRLEAPLLKAYLPNGGDSSLYALVKED